MKNLTTLTMVGLCLCMMPIEAQAPPESRAAVLFLLIEPGARAIAMGESYVAIADDATASYFNPAALSGQTRKKLNFIEGPVSIAVTLLQCLLVAPPLRRRYCLHRHRGATFRLLGVVQHPKC